MSEHRIADDLGLRHVGNGQAEEAGDDCIPDVAAGEVARLERLLDTYARFHGYLEDTGQL